MNEKIKNWSIGLVIIGVLFLSGCASVQIVGKPSSFKTLPAIVVAGDITLADEKVGIPSEKIREGRDILFENFKKGLSEFNVLKSIQDLPPGVEDYLLVETKIRLYQEARPFVMSTVTLEMTVTRYREKEVILKYPVAYFAGFLRGKSAAYTIGLTNGAQKVAAAIKRHARK